jgi:hypothetical protein
MPLMLSRYLPVSSLVPLILLRTSSGMASAGAMAAAIAVAGRQVSSD